MIWRHSANGRLGRICARHRRATRGAPKTARRIREAGAADPPATGRRRGGVLNITVAVWTAGFYWWRSGNKKRMQNVSEYIRSMPGFIIFTTCHFCGITSVSEADHWCNQWCLVCSLFCHAVLFVTRRSCMRSFSSVEKQQECTKPRLEGSCMMIGSVGVTYLFILWDVT